LASGGSEGLAVSSLSQRSGPKSLFNGCPCLDHHNQAVEHNVSLQLAIAATIAKNKDHDPVSLLRKVFAVFLPPNQLTSQSFGVSFVELMEVLSDPYLPATPLPALHFAEAKCMGCVAYDLLALGGFDVEGIGHGYEIEDVLLRLLFQHQRALMPWIGEPPAPQAQSISLAKTEFSSAGGATLPPQGWQLGLHTIDFSKMWQMQLELVNPQLKATLDMSQPPRFCLQQLFDQHRADLRAKIDAGRLVRNISWNDQVAGLPPPLTAECIATWLVSPKVSACWNETSRNEKINTCFQKVLDLLKVPVPIATEHTSPPLEPRSDISADAPSHYFEPRPKKKTTPFFEPRPKTVPAQGCTSKSKPMEKAPLPSASFAPAVSEVGVVPGGNSSSSTDPPAEEKQPECEIFGISAQATQQQQSQVKQSKAKGSVQFPGVDGPGLFLVTFGVAYVGQGLCNFGSCDDWVKAKYLQRAPGDPMDEEEAAEIVSATVGVDLFSGDPRMGSLRQVEVVALDARLCGTLPSELEGHIGQHPSILRYIISHDHFPPWLRYALDTVYAASQKLEYDKQSRLHICCFDNQGRILSVTLLAFIFSQTF
jgi:hypothetical protein